MNEQRTYVYGMRNRVLDNEDSSAVVHAMIDRAVETNIADYSIDGRRFDSETVEAIKRWIELDMRIPIEIGPIDDVKNINQKEFSDTLKASLQALYQAREQSMGSEKMRILERLVMLNTLDSRWKDHLYEMDALKEGINWMSYAEKDPLVEYKLRGMDIFNQMIANFDNEAVALLYHAELTSHEMPEPEFSQYDQGQASHDQFGQFGAVGGGQPQRQALPGQRQQAARGGKVGRNDPCPCGSGKKYKHCHGLQG
jgi:preprotein translocase subunit SecA